MPTTSNFGWTTPADTDLVKDGAAAIRTLGNGIDTSLVDLKGGTTGQVLSKATNTDLDYTWVTPNVGDITEVQAGTGISVASGTGPIPVITNTVATAFDAAGDLVYGTGADTFTKLSLGTAGQVLKVNSGATAPEWGTAAGAAWQDWTPTLTNVTVGNSTQVAKYLDVNGTIYFFYQYYFGSTASITGHPAVSLPATPDSSQDNFAMFYGIIREAGVQTFAGSFNIDLPNSRLDWRVINSSSTYGVINNVSSTVPMSWSTNDFVSLWGFYKKA